MLKRILTAGFVTTVLGLAAFAALPTSNTTQVAAETAPPVPINPGCKQCPVKASG